MSGPALSPIHLKLLACLSLTPQTFAEVHGRLLFKGVKTNPAKALGQLVTLGLAAQHGSRKSFRYSLTDAGEQRLDEAAP